MKTLKPSTCTYIKDCDKSALPRLEKRSSRSLFGILCFAFLVMFMSGCKKDNNLNGSFNYELFYNTKWLTVSQAATPTWTYPATGKSYNDFWDFTKDVFPCLVDDYIVYYKDGTTQLFYNTLKCDPNDPSETAPTGYYFLDKPEDSLFLAVPFEVPGQKPQLINVRCKVLDVQRDKLVVRYNQTVPFTFTTHTVTETYKAMP
jgi:hypothetical protein